MIDIKVFARVGWSFNDLTGKYKISSLRAILFLQENEAAIQDAMVRAGMESIESLVPADWKERENQ